MSLISGDDELLEYNNCSVNPRDLILCIIYKANLNMFWGKRGETRRRLVCMQYVSRVHVKDITVKLSTNRFECYIF
jgi:hypothetical protein